MGESKRRKQLDSTYGKVPSLTSSSQKQKHVSLIIEALSTQFASEIKQIAAAESLLESYSSYRDQVSNWINQKLASYQPEDRTLIASSIMTCYAQIASEQGASPLLIKFWFDVLEPILPHDKRQRLKAISDQIEAQLSLTSFKA
ncbi:MAG: hypothetical protein AAF383_20500 [Cyanobacteria bacterium P01_A01_bin.83]